MQLDALAAVQHGAFSRPQVIEIGFSPDQIFRRLRAGEWVRAAAGVYRVASAGQTWLSDVSCAVLSCPLGSAASHATAAFLHELTRRRPTTIEVVVPRGRLRSRAFVVHQSTDLDATHVTIVDGIVTTTIDRTIVDVGVPHGIGMAARSLDEARRLGTADLVGVDRLRASVARRGRNGVGPARRVIGERKAWDSITESSLEDRFLRMIQRSGLPRPVGQYTVSDDRMRFVGRVDFAYPENAVLIELDGAAFHMDTASFQRDRERQNRLLLLGFTVLRFTYWDLTEREPVVIDSILRALSSKLSR